MQLSISSIASTSAQQDFEWYIYKGSTFTVTGGTARAQVKEGTRVGIRPVARSKDYYIVTEDAPKKLFKITKQRATKIAGTGKRIKRVILQGDQPTAKTKEILDDAATQKFDADRFKPLGTVRNEAFGRDGTEAFGVDTTNYQWRVVRDPEYLIQTNKRPIKLRRGDKIGMRFGRPSQGGKIVDLNGMYETVTTAEYDRIASDLPVMPKGRWPQTVVTPEMIKEYQLNKERQRVRERNEREKEERAQQAAVRNAEREAKQQKEEEERQRRALEAKEHGEIVKQIDEAAKAETAKAEQLKEERRAKAGLQDEDLRNAKASKMQPLEHALEEEDVDDDEDFGEDLEGDVTRQSDDKKAERVKENDVEKAKLDARKRAEDISLRMAEALKAVIEAAGDDKEAEAEARAEYKADAKTLKAADTTDEDKDAIVAKWEAKANGGEEEQEEDPAAAEEEEQEEDPAAAEEEEQEEDPDATDESPDDEDFEEEEEDPASTDEEQEEDPDATDESPDDEEFEEEDDGSEEGDEDFEEDDADAAAGDESPDDEEFEEEEEDPAAGDDSPDDEAFEEEEQDDEDFEPTADDDADLDDMEEPEIDEDSAGIADTLRDNPDAQDFDDDDAVSDLADVDEEDIGKEPEEEKTPPKDASKKPKAKEEAPPEESEDDPLEFEDEEDPEAEAEVPKPAGIKDTQTAEEGDLLTFHDDTKLKRRFLLVSAEPMEQNDRIIVYKLWDFDSKPETYRTVRVATDRGQSILKYADKVGQVTPKEFNEAQDAVDNAEHDKSAIKS